jgi:hypothetical protein
MGRRAPEGRVEVARPGEGKRTMHEDNATEDEDKRQIDEEVAEGEGAREN